MAGSKKTFWDLALKITGQDKGASAALQSLKKNVESVQSAGKQLGKDFNGFTSSAAKLTLGVVGSVAAAGAGVFAMANSFADAGDKVAKTADSLGMAIEGYQKLKYAMADSGVEAGEFDAAIQKMTNTINLGVAGNEAARKQLGSIGLSAAKLASMKPERAFERIADYMLTLPNDASRAQVAITLFGKTAGPKMAAAMKMGSKGIQALGKEAESLGVIFTKNQARASAQYKSQLARLGQSVTGMKNQFISGALGPLTEAFQTLTGTIQGQMPSIRELGDRFGRWLGNMVARLPEIITRVKELGEHIADTAIKVKDLVGGWENMAKITAGVIVAPTAIKGVKVLWSFGKFLRTAIPAIGASFVALKTGGAVALAGIAGAALPVVAIIAGIAAVIYTIVRNFDTLKQYALDCIERIKASFSGSTGGIAVDWQKVGQVTKDVLGVIVKILEGSILLAIKTAMNFLTSAVQMAIGTFKVLWGIVQAVWDILKTGTKVISALFRGDLTGAIDEVSGLLGRLSKIGQDMVDGLKVIFGGVADFWKILFKDSIDFVSQALGSFGINAENVFNGVKSAISAVGQFFVDTWNVAVNGVKSVINGISAFFQNIWKGIGRFMNGEDISIAFAPVMNSLQQIAGPIIGKISSAWEKLTGSGNKGAKTWTKALGTVRNILKIIASIMGGTVLLAIKTMVNAVKNGITVIKGVFDTLKSVVGLVLWPFETIEKVVKAFLADGMAGAFNAAKEQFEKLGGIFTNIFEGIKTILNGFATFFRNFFNDLITWAKGIIETLGDKFSNVFDSIKNLVTSFVGFFTDKFKAVGDAIGVVSNFLGNLGKNSAEAGKAAVKNLSTHADGGIFTTRHIAEICEKGPEAVVPLNKSQNGFNIWKQAGLIGGYIKKTATETATGNSSTPETTPVMSAAASKILSSQNAINIDLKMTNNFSGSPDSKAVKQIAVAGQKAADDIEKQVKAAMENILRRNHRVSYA